MKENQEKAAALQYTGEVEVDSAPAVVDKSSGLVAEKIISSHAQERVPVHGDRT
jgi:type III secretion system FlhB-like substrate exporter